MTNNKTDWKIFPPKVPNDVLAKNNAKIRPLRIKYFINLLENVAFHRYPRFQTKLTRGTLKDVKASLKKSIGVYAEVDEMKKINGELNLCINK